MEVEINISTLLSYGACMFKVARNSLLACATCAAEHCHWIMADARNIQT